jgi:hypothetical protein
MLKDSELKNACRLAVDSTNALFKKCNREPLRMRITQPPPLMLHLKHTDPAGCIGAFEGDRMIGFASSLIRENQWYLGFLFTAPGRWSRGIGRKLLKRVLATANPQEVDLFSLCTFSCNPQAVALYSSFGIPPQSVILNMEWQAVKNRKIRLPRPESMLDIKSIGDYENLSFINKLDKRNRGVTRPEDHKFFIDQDKTELISFHEERKPIGYAAIHDNGWIAPVSAVEASYLPDMLDLCIRRQLGRKRKQILVSCAGSNTAILQHLLKAGFLVKDPILLMSNRLFGNLSCYLPAHLAIF